MNTNQTSTNQTNMKSKEQWIKEVQERLDWYTFQAAEEEFNAQEVEALVALLSTLEADTETPMPEPKVDFEAFMRYREMREADAQKRAALHGGAGAEAAVEIAGSEGDGSRHVDSHSESEMEGVGSRHGDSHSESGIKGDGSKHVDSLGNAESPRRFGGKILGGRHRFAKIASVAAVLVMLTVGGAVGAVNAAKGGDFIMWLRKDKQGEKMVIEPKKNALNQMEENVNNIYYNIEDVPEEYQEYFVDFNEMETLKGYELSQIEISEYEGSRQIFFLLQKEKQEIYLGVRVFQNNVVVRESSFDDYEYVGNEEINGNELEVYQKADNIDGWDAIICFYDESIQYFTYGNCSIEVLELFAAEYAEKIFEKN